MTLPMHTYLSNLNASSPPEMGGGGENGFNNIVLPMGTMPQGPQNWHNAMKKYHSHLAAQWPMQCFVLCRLGISLVPGLPYSIEEMTVDIFLDLIQLSGVTDAGKIAHLEIVG